MGKLPWKILSRAIGKLPVKDPDLVIGPGIGEDAAVIKFSNGFLVAHTDPVTAAIHRIGWYAINVAANDIAVRGVKPRWFMATVLLPPGITEEEIMVIFNDMGEAARELGGVVISGHTEVTPGLNRPIIIVSALGYTGGRVVLTRDARPGDKILVVGRIGGEGASIIAHDFEERLVEMGVDRGAISKAKEYIRDISVVEKALLLKDLGVNAMHDPTEGGLLQALREIALASNTEAHIYIERIRIDPVVELIAKTMDLDPLKLLSSGTVVATINPEKIDKVTEYLDKEEIEYSIIGEIRETDNPGRVIVYYPDGNKTVINEDIIDEIYKLFKSTLH